MTTPEESAKFRREATVVFQATLGGLIALAVAIVCGGWWLAGWWGLAGGILLGGGLLVAGATAAGILYAMTQDSA